MCHAHDKEKGLTLVVLQPVCRLHDPGRPFPGALITLRFSYYNPDTELFFVCRDPPPGQVDVALAPKIHALYPVGPGDEGRAEEMVRNCRKNTERRRGSEVKAKSAVGGAPCRQEGGEGGGGGGGDSKKQPNFEEMPGNSCTIWGAAFHSSDEASRHGNEVRWYVPAADYDYETAAPGRLVLAVLLERHRPYLCFKIDVTFTSSPPRRQEPKINLVDAREVWTPMGQKPVDPKWTDVELKALAEYRSNDALRELTVCAG